MTRQTLGDFSRFFVHRDTSWAPLKQTRSSAERALLDEKAAAAGVTLSQLIRSAVLGHQLPSPPIVREAMSELHRVGVNLNQLTRRRRQYDRRHAPSPSDLNAELGQQIAGEIGGVFCRVDVTSEAEAARHPGRARSRRALRPRCRRSAKPARPSSTRTLLPVGRDNVLTGQRAGPVNLVEHDNFVRVDMDTRRCSACPTRTSAKR